MIYDILRGLFFLFCCTSIIYSLYAIYAAYDFFNQKFPDKSDFTPEVTIIKPLCGLDYNLYNNIASFCLQDYPSYQIIFTLASCDDPALPIVQQIQKDFAHLDLSLVVCAKTIGTNLKISNMANAIHLAKHNILVFSDSDIKVKSDYLKQIVQPLFDQQVAVVTCPYNSLVDGKIAIFESLGIATGFNPKILVARKLEGVSWAFGSTIAIRKLVLEEIGGLKAIANYLSDDFHLGNLPYKLGYQVTLIPYVVEHASADVKINELFARQLRWSKGVRVERFWGYVGLIFTQGTINSILFLCLTNFSTNGCLVLLSTWLVRLSMAYIVGVILFQDKLVNKYLIWVFLRDIFDFFIWIMGFMGNTIAWKDKKFKLNKNGKLSLIE